MNELTKTLLAADEPRAVTVYNANATSPFLLVADHAGNLIPRALGRLGLAAAELQRHIGWDIGIAGLGRWLAEALDATLIQQNYSRLAIDCNRPLEASSSIPAISELTEIPGNAGLTDADKMARADEIFRPYHDRIEAELDRRRQSGQATALVSLHSFTPVYAGIKRPWHVGTLYQSDTRLPPLLLKGLRAQADLVVGDNEPYAVSNETDYTIPVHGEARGLMNTGIEIRQDLISDQAGEAEWAERLAAIFGEIEAELRMQALLPAA